MADPRIPEWVTVKVAAALVGKAPRTIYEWIENDRLAFRRNGDGVLESCPRLSCASSPR